MRAINNLNYFNENDLLYNFHNKVKENPYNKSIKKVNNSNRKESKQYLPLTKEWNNSIYNYNKNKTIKTLLIKDKYISKLFNNYFNLKKVKQIKKNKFSIIKIFIGKQEVKHFNNVIITTLCIFNKEKILCKKEIYKLYKKLFKAVILNILSLNKKNHFILKLFFKDLENLFNKKEFNIINNLITCNKIILYNKLFYNKKIYRNLKYKYKYMVFIKYLLKKYKKLFIYKKKIIMLNLNNYKFNINNFLGIKNISNKIYNKKIEYNLINLKYLYLDSSILTEALGIKLKNRKNKLLNNIIKAIALVKIPYINEYKYLTENNNFSLSNTSIIKNHNTKDIITIKNIIYIPIHKLSIALYNLKYKVINGIKVQGTGRLTERLTALRSVSKSRQKGSLKNVCSSYYKLSTIMLIGHIKSNLQYVKKNYNNRNGSYGIKVHISSY